MYSADECRTADRRRDVHNGEPAEHSMLPFGIDDYGVDWKPEVPLTLEQIIDKVRFEFPGAGIYITCRGRTIREQALLMARRRRKDREDFLKTYKTGKYIHDLDKWATDHPFASEKSATDEFERVLKRARQNGATISRHLTDQARDISIPIGGSKIQQLVRKRLQAYGVHILNEEDAATGPHWHLQ